MRPFAAAVLAFAFTGCAAASWLYEGALLQRHREALIECLRGSRHIDHDEACWDVYRVNRALRPGEDEGQGNK